MSVGYGKDTWCLGAYSPGRYATGWRVVAQALYRRLITPRGTLRGGPEESAYGFDVEEYIGAVGYDTAVQALPALVRGELMKDKRVSDVSVRASKTSNSAGEVSIALTIDVALADESGSFALTLSASDAAVHFQNATFAEAA